ncbi:MAG: NADH:flavin oxidoreductase/NADH oxidase [Microvirga sp.]|nr:NADH:flavin oxidoreductase/NADH oxidase [Microvirga sp.]
MSENERRIQRPSRDPFLFRPIRFRSVEARNRLMMSPMCQYSAQDGVANDWHFGHIAARAAGGIGILCVEATHVSPIGRITPNCLGLWNDAQRDALARIVAHVKSLGATPAIQLAHAGRKASVSTPWTGTKPVPVPDGGWEVIGPSAVPQSPDAPTPRAMDKGDIAQVVEEFRAATRRSLEAGFEVLEIHAAHGYLLHSFLSPLSNFRADEYGGSLENRMRFLHETLDAVRKEWPQELPLFVRISATDWHEAGLDLNASIEIARALKARGDVDLIDCSTGGVHHAQKIAPYPGYQVPFAEGIRRAVDIPTGAVGLISTPEQAEEILAGGRADLVLLGRVLLFNPHWPLHAANRLHADHVRWPEQYERSNIF